MWGQREPMGTKWVVGWRPAALGMVKQTVGGEDVGYWCEDTSGLISDP